MIDRWTDTATRQRKIESLRKRVPPGGRVYTIRLTKMDYTHKNVYAVLLADYKEVVNITQDVAAALCRKLHPSGGVCASTHAQLITDLSLVLHGEQDVGSNVGYPTEDGPRRRLPTPKWYKAGCSLVHKEL